MAGAAAVIGAMQAVAQLDLPLHVVALAPACENLPSGHAYKPGDVLKAMNGKTIEIISTDAEGRLILADALCYAERYHPSAVIDLATLTGACVVALGDMVAAGIFSTDDDLSAKLREAGTQAGEKLWPLPLYEEYKDKIKSEVADMKNSGGRQGGVGSSAIFLKEFTSYPWAHLDIAPMSLGDKGHTRPALACGRWLSSCADALLASMNGVQCLSRPSPVRCDGRGPFCRAHLHAAPGCVVATWHFPSGGALVL